jgi:hypothetical protein
VSDFVGWAGLVLAIIALPPMWARLTLLWNTLVRMGRPIEDDWTPMLWVEPENGGRRIRVTNPTSDRLKYVQVALLGTQVSYDRSKSGPTLPPGGSMVWDVPGGTTPEQQAHVQWVGPPSYTLKWLDRRRPNGWHRDTFRLHQVKDDGPAGLATRQMWRFESKWVAWETEATPWQDAAAEFDRDYRARGGT